MSKSLQHASPSCCVWGLMMGRELKSTWTAPSGSEADIYKRRASFEMSFHQEVVEMTSYLKNLFIIKIYIWAVKSLFLKRTQKLPKYPMLWWRLTTDIGFLCVCVPPPWCSRHVMIFISFTLSAAIRTDRWIILWSVGERPALQHPAHRRTHGRTGTLTHFRWFQKRFNTHVKVFGHHHCSFCTNIPHPSEGRADLICCQSENVENIHIMSFYCPAGAYGHPPVTITLKYFISVVLLLFSHF